MVLGDVEGHGAEAAALTAMVRYTVRTAGMIDGDLLQAFRILNRQLRARERPMLCSVVCLTLGPGAEAAVVSAGHPLPLVVSEGVSREVGLPGSLLGALEDPQWSPVRFMRRARRGACRLHRRRGRGAAQRRPLRPRAAGGPLAPPGGPAEVVQRVGEAIESFAETVQDDAAMLVLRRDREVREGDAALTQVPQEIG